MALVGVITLFAGLGLVTFALKDRNSPDLRLGDQVFNAGNAKNISVTIAEHGPMLFSDVSGRRDRDMLLQHIGSKADKGWHAFLASPDDKPRDCVWEWQEDEEIFRAKCDKNLTAPANGKGLTRFKVTVEDGRVKVDLNAKQRAEQTKVNRDKASTTTRR